MRWILLRGLTREAGHWGRFAARLAEEIGDPVECLDLAGCGAARRTPSPQRIEAIVADLRRRAGNGRIGVIGLSLGGMAALHWASVDALAACVTINTSLAGLSGLHLRLRPANWPALARILLGTDESAAERLVLELTSSRPRDHRAVVAEWIAIRRQRPVARADALRQLIAAARYRQRETPGSPAPPHLIVCSEGDRLVDPRCSKVIATRWNWPLAVHGSAGHDLALDEPQWLARTIAQWWSGVRLNLETALGRARVGCDAAGWQGVTTMWTACPRGGATPPADRSAAQSGA